MDQPDLDPTEHHQALRGLARVNAISRTVSSMWSPIAQLARQQGRSIRVLDVASGGGDTAIGLWKRAKRAGLDVEVIGCDLSDTAIGYANDRAADLDAQVQFFRADALSGELPEDCDVICCSLFLHHLDEPDVVALLAAMRERTRCMIVASDLIRSRLGYALCWGGIRLLTRSRICHVDGPLSVQGAFTIPELRQLAVAAGLDGMTFQRCWPERCLMTWKRS